jgi:serine/threonine protein kinase
LKKGLHDDELKMEEDVLRVINIQSHNNIMDIIAFYSWRDQVNFVFPFVQLNLYEVLHQDWRPEQFAEPSQKDCRSHWMWQQLIGVADALRTIHNPPIQPFPKLGKIVGFHFDLKPANVMVRHDGRLLVTDFGQSMVKIVQENELVYGDYVGGDYTYQPPEVCPSRNEWKATLMSVEASIQQPSTSPSSTTVTSSDSRKNSYGTAKSIDMRQESKRSRISFSSNYHADSFSHETASSRSQFSPSATSDVSRVTATTNYDVWSLACIMLEVLVFIYMDGSEGVTTFERSRNGEERALSFHNGSGVNAQLKQCVASVLDELRTLGDGIDKSESRPRTSYLWDTVDLLYGMFRSDPKARKSSEDVVNELEKIREVHADDDSPGDPMLRYMDGMPTPRGFREVGWCPKDTSRGVESFYHM